MKKNRSVLVNFRMSNYLKSRLDHIAHSKQISKTYIINSLIEEYIRDEYKKLIADRDMTNLFIQATDRLDQYHNQKNKLEMTPVYFKHDTGAREL